MTLPLDPLVAVVLGAVQGLTEFLPVSSSGHLAMGALVFGIPDLPLSIVVVMHAGTLVATLAAFGTDIGHLGRSTFRGLGSPLRFARTKEGNMVGGILLASVPTAVIGLLLKERVEDWAHSPLAVGVLLLVSAAIVWTTRRERAGRATLPFGAYLLIGIAQGFAVLPGVSRSGTTIAAAMLLGMRAPDAFRFSFLLSLPAVSGAVLLEFSGRDALQGLGTSAWIAGVVAMVTGYGALRLLRRVVIAGRLWVFSVYLVAVGLALMSWALLGGSG